MSMPRSVKPMLATLVKEPFDRPRWYFEVKWDGYRALARVERGTAHLTSRNGISFDDVYAPIAQALAKAKHSCILDGEIIALVHGKPDFHALQQYRDAAKKPPLQYVVFDLLYLDGKSVMDKPLKERKALLRGVLPKAPALLYSEHVEAAGTQFFTQMRRRKLEGMVAKDSLSRYEPGRRSKSWLKVKAARSQEAVIVGYTAPRGTRKDLGALVLAAREHGKLAYIGHSGGGFTHEELRELRLKLDKLRVRTPTLAEEVPVDTPVTWVKPHYVCEVEFTEWTPEGRMRHPTFKGLRVDKKPSEVVKEIAK